MVLHLKIIGMILIILALIHAQFPRYFKWRSDLGTISAINREMMYIHTLFIALAVFLMGILCISSSLELTTTTLGRKLCLGLGIFWFTRLLVQFIGYSSMHWKGKRFETVVHIVFSLFWAYTSFVFLFIFFKP